MPPSPLSRGEVHTWYLSYSEGQTHPWERCLTWLSSEEQARCSRFIFEKHRREHLLTGVLLRAMLSHYTGIHPRDWTFCTNQYGRPEIAAPALEVPLAFNMSNTEGMVVGAIANAAEVGIDIEDLRRPAALDAADRFFSPSEVAALRALPTEMRDSRFFDYWTLKESYIKARGMGLAIPLDRFSIILDRDPIAIEIDPSLGDSAESWRFERKDFGGHYAVAIARRAFAGEIDTEMRVKLSDALTLPFPW